MWTDLGIALSEAWSSLCAAISVSQALSVLARLGRILGPGSLCGVRTPVTGTVDTLHRNIQYYYSRVVHAALPEGDHTARMNGIGLVPSITRCMLLEVPMMCLGLVLLFLVREGRKSNAPEKR